MGNAEKILYKYVSVEVFFFFFLNRRLLTYEHKNVTHRISGSILINKVVVD